MSTPSDAAANSLGNASLLFVFCAVLAVSIPISYFYLDRPLEMVVAALHLNWNLIYALLRLQPTILVVGLGSLLLVTGCSVIAGRRVAGSETVIKASISAVSSYLVTEVLLKPLFGRTFPSAFVRQGDYGMHWLHYGPNFAAFPSGHAAATTAFAYVVCRRWPEWRAPVALSVGILGLFLMLGSWHFLSDVCAGTLLGVLTGIAVERVADHRQFLALKLHRLIAGA